MVQRYTKPALLFLPKDMIVPGFLEIPIWNIAMAVSETRKCDSNPYLTVMLGSVEGQNWVFQPTTKIAWVYPLVNLQKAMENHHFSWENPLFLWPFSIAMFIYQRAVVYICFNHPYFFPANLMTSRDLHSLENWTQLISKQNRKQTKKTYDKANKKRTNKKKQTTIKHNQQNNKQTKKQ